MILKFLFVISVVYIKRVCLFSSLSDEAAEEASEEGAHHGDPTERRQRGRQGQVRARPPREADFGESDLRPGRDDRLHRRDARSRSEGRHLALAHAQAAAQDPQGPAQGGLHRRLASLACLVRRGQGRSEGLPPPHRDKQEDLPHWQRRRQGQRQDRVRPRREVHHPNGK